MSVQTFKNIDDILHKDAGCTRELDWPEQPSWVLFMKPLDVLESDRVAEAELEGRAHSFLLAKPSRAGACSASGLRRFPSKTRAAPGRGATTRRSPLPACSRPSAPGATVSCSRIPRRPTRSRLYKA